MVRARRPAPQQIHRQPEVDGPGPTAQMVMASIAFLEIFHMGTPTVNPTLQPTQRKIHQRLGRTTYMLMTQALMNHTQQK